MATLKGQRAICHELVAPVGTVNDVIWTEALNATGAVDYTNGTDGMKFVAPAVADRAFLHLGDDLRFDIDNLQAFEVEIKKANWSANSTAIIGLGSAFNADPDAIAASAWFKFAGTALVIETDDGVTNIDDQATNIAVPDGSWIRLRADFETGVQSIAPPGSSKGGKASVKFSATNADGYCIHIPTSVHMDMSGYALGLQPIVGMLQATATGTAELYLRSFRVWEKGVA